MNWTPNQPNRIVFVMVDSNSTEVAGLGAGFTLSVCKSGGVFVASGGTKAEIGNGWYSYVSTAAEADTLGPVAVRVTGAGCAQQNLAYTVGTMVDGAIEFTYTVTNATTLLPEPNVKVEFCTDAARVNVVWVGYTDTFGIARDTNGNKPWLVSGTYYIRNTKGSDVSYDTEVVS